MEREKFKILDNVRFIMKKGHIFTLMLLAFSLFANAQQFRLKAPEFVIGNESAMQMSDMLPKMKQQLRQDLSKRADIALVDEEAQGGNCKCELKDIQVLKNVFTGSEYKAWHIRVIVSVQVQAELNGNANVREFSITRRIRSTSGEPQLDAALFNEIAKDIVSKCYVELVDIVECN